MTNANDQNQDQIDPNNPPVAMPEAGTTAKKIKVLEKMENGLVAQLYNTKDKDEQELITRKMDYISTLLGKLSESQKAVEAAGKTVTQHQDGGFTPHDKIRALDVLMSEAAAGGDMSTYKMYRTQKRDLVRKYGTPGHTTSTSARNPRIDELKKIANSYQSEHCGASIETRMEAAANAGDMATYKELRAQYKQQHQQA